MFMSCIFYPTSVLPEDLSRYRFLNPLTQPILQARAMLSGRGVFAPYVGLAGMVGCEKTAQGVADVL